MKVKRNYIPRLTRELEQTRTLPQSMRRVQIGPACEVYHPLAVRAMQDDETTGLMSRVLACFVREKEQGYPWAIHVVTKSGLVLGDTELLKELGAQVEITLTTLDERVKLLWEGKAPSVRNRLQTIESLAKAGVFVRAMAMPLFSVSGDNDERMSVARELMRVTFEHGACAFKMKGLNYFSPEMLLAGEKTKVKGRSESVKGEILVRSGELVEQWMNFGYYVSCPSLQFSDCL